MNLDNPENLPIPHSTVTELVRTYREAEAEIRRCFDALVAVEQKLKAAFSAGDRSYAFDIASSHGEHARFDQPDRTMKRIKKDAWRVLVDRMELRRILSNKRIAELDKQLETGEGLPEIEEEQIRGMMDGTIQQASSYIGELVRETFEWLTPQRNRWGIGYKTNKPDEVGKKVIRPGCVQHKWSGGFEVNYYRQDHISGLDRVMHALDGKGMPKTYRGPLSDAISASGPEGKGETDYFKFKCYGNGNLHIEFKRLDLVAELNRVAGGMALKQQEVA